MSESDMSSGSSRSVATLAAALPGLPRDDDGPVFSEAWQAEAFAMTITLTEAGVFTWPEWVDALTAAIAAAQAGGDPDLGDTYYEHWSSALEGLCAAKGVVGVVGVDERQEQWRRAYLNTPHGQPVELAAGG